MRKSIFAIVIAVFMLQGLPPALGAPAATVAIDTTVSDCESGRLLITTTGISGGRQFWRAIATDPVTNAQSLLGEREEEGPAAGYSGALDFPFLTGPVPYGIAVTLYGYQGTTPPTPATTAEFAVTYVCDTLEILSTSAGPYGAVTILPIPADIPALSRQVLCGLALSLLAFGAVRLRRRTSE